MPALVVFPVFVVLAVLVPSSRVSAQVEPLPAPRLTIDLSSPPPGLATPELRLDWLEAASAELVAQGRRDEALGLLDRYATPDLLVDRSTIRRLIHLTDRVEPPPADSTLLWIGIPVTATGGACVVLCSIAALVVAWDRDDIDDPPFESIVIAGVTVAMLGAVLMALHLFERFKPERVDFLDRRSALVERLRVAYRHAPRR